MTVQAQPKKRVKFRYKHPIIHWAFVIGCMTAFFVGTGSMLYVQHVLKSTPTVTEYMLKSDGTSNMYDSKGNLIWSDTKVRRDYVAFKDLPKTYIDALLSTEDATFYTDEGYSKKGLLNAFVSTIKSKVFKKGEQRGGSSIEQQLVKNAIEDDEHSIDRKIRELWLAQQLYQNFSKDKILEYYVNKINMGENSYGADTIAMTYFGHHLKDYAEKTPENISKLALIAGLGQAPSSYNLYDNPELVEKRRNIVLLSMYNNNKLSKKEIDAVKKVPITKDLKERYWRNTEIQSQVAKYNAYVYSTLDELKKLGYDIEKTPLQIYTHLDPDQYNWLTNEVANPSHYQDEGQQVAATVVDVKSGAVIAQAGGRYADQANSLNRATQRTRSSGSSIKPFIDYAPMIEYFGMGTNAVWSSAPYTYPGTAITAYNYGGYTYGDVTAQYALRMSLNTPVLRMLDGTIGSALAKNMLANFGLDVKDSYGGSDALGLDVSTEDMALAFATLARGGVYADASYIKELVFSDGSKKEIKPQSKRTIKESTAFTLNSMLEGVTATGMSGEKAAIPEIPGLITKTGTVGYDNSDGVWRPDMAASDSWMAGATKSIAVAIWTGYDSPNEPGHWLESTTSTRYSLYQAIMRHYNAGRDTSKWTKPSTVTDLGGGHFKPNDTQAEILNPLVQESATDTNVKNLSGLFKSIDITAGIPKPSIPKDFNKDKWVDNLTADEKTIYKKWKDGPGTLPSPADNPDVYVSTNE